MSLRLRAQSFDTDCDGRLQLRFCWRFSFEKKIVPIAVWLAKEAFVGRVKQGRFVILRFPLFCSVWGSQTTQIQGKTARKVSLSHPLLCAPNASKN